MMKRILTLIVCATALSVGAQIPYEFPYNPDADNDAFISTTDLVEFLALFGQDFASEELYLNGDSTSLVVFVGQLIAQECRHACASLEGHWRVLNYEDLDTHYSQLALEIEVPDDADYWPYMWVDEADEFNEPWTDLKLRNRNRRFAFSDDGSIFEIGAFQSIYNANGNFGFAYECWCATQQRPRVEYKAQEVTQETLELILNENAQDGWIFLPSGGPLGSGDQAFFWRWAD